MGEHTLRTAPNLTLGVILVFTIAMAVAGIIGIVGQFN
jgi:hypothetical protein